MGQLTMKEYLIEIIGVTNVSIGATFKDNNDFTNRLEAQIHCKPKSKTLWKVFQSNDIHIRNMAMTECSVKVNITDLPRKLYTDVIIADTLLDTTAILIVNATNVTLTNIHANNSNGTVLLGINIEKSLYITTCTLNGTLQLSYSNPPLHLRYSNPMATVTGTTKLQVHNSKVIPGIHQKSGISYQEGITISVELANNRLDIIFSNISFSGYSEIRGFTLSVSYGSCSVFSVLLSKLHIIRSGISVTWHEYTKCINCLEQRGVTIIDTKLEMIHSRLIIDGIPTHNVDCFSLAISNSTISDSTTGVRLFDVNARLTNTTFFNNSGALYIRKTTMTLEGKSSFLHNTNRRDFSAILLKSSTVNFQGLTLIKGNIGQKYAAVVARNSTLFFKEEIHFIENRGFYGGALSLYMGS